MLTLPKFGTILSDLWFYQLFKMSVYALFIEIL